MTRNVVTIALFVLLNISRALHADDGAQQPTNLDGTWRIEELVLDGSKFSSDAHEQFSFHIDGATWRYTFYVNNKPFTAVFAVTLDRDQSPIAVDAQLRNGARAGGVCKGICEIDGETIKLCMGDRPSVARPDRFECPPGSHRHLIVLRRVNSPPQKVAGDS